MIRSKNMSVKKEVIYHFSQELLISLKYYTERLDLINILNTVV